MYWKVESLSSKYGFYTIPKISFQKQNYKVRVMLSVCDGKLNCQSHVKKKKVKWKPGDKTT